MTVTIKDVAKKADVSYATVSRALNGKYGVRDKTREKILAVARAMGYTPNAIARGLVKRQTHTIGLIIPDITNPFYPEVARGIEDQARASGYSVFLCNTNYDKQREADYLNLLSEKRVDGIIMAPISNQSAQRLEEAGNMIPVVYVTKRVSGNALSFVVIDDERGGFIATKYLIEQGYKTIGYIGPDEKTGNDPGERLAGFRAAFKKFGISVQSRYVRIADFKRETGYNAIARMIEAGNFPRAVFAGNDLLAIGMIQGIKEKGLSVPRDIAIIGFDNIPLAAFPEIRLTTIHQPKYEMGQMAADILLEKIEKRTPGQPRRVILEPELIVRSSS